MTLSANYKEIFAAETVKQIDELLDEQYALDDILEFIDENSEEDFVNHYVDYVDAGENIGYDVVDAFIKYHGDVSYVNYVSDAFRGTYDSEADFAEEWVSDCMGLEIPAFVVVDWEATWNQNLRYDFDFVDGYVFDSNF